MSNAYAINFYAGEPHLITDITGNLFDHKSNIVSLYYISSSFIILNASTLHKKLRKLYCNHKNEHQES